MRKLLVVMAITTGLAAAWIAIGWTQPPAAKTPIKVGVLYPFKGPFAVLGELQLVGMKLAFDQRGNRIAGREVQLVVEDDEAKPDVGLTKVRKLIEQEKVAVLAGIVSSAVAYAVRGAVHDAKMPLVITMANSG
ncbi:MAG TPA: ABC transporter substrate-binding protein, partial [Methylomirabilota bacterium]|nr:ABC transporter substrate-binding protein [Methylomirabilota bacterium]